MIVNGHFYTEQRQSKQSHPRQPLAGLTSKITEATSSQTSKTRRRPQAKPQKSRRWPHCLYGRSASASTSRSLSLGGRIKRARSDDLMQLKPRSARNNGM